MAIWQFDCYIAPGRNADNNIKLEMEEMVAWGKQDTSIERIDFLEKQESWSAEISQYGKEEETCIKFFYEDGVLEGINCRLDLRSLTKEMLERILDYVRKIEGFIFYDNKIFPPNIEEIVELMKCSNANKFCQNPMNYFGDLSKKYQR